MGPDQKPFSKRVCINFLKTKKEDGESPWLLSKKWMCHWAKKTISVLTMVTWFVSHATHPPQQPIAVSFTPTTLLAKSWLSLSLTGCGWSRSASMVKGRTPFDKTNFRSSGVSAKFHKKLRQHSWSTSCPWLKWCFNCCMIMVSIKLQLLLKRMNAISRKYKKHIAQLSVIKLEGMHKDYSSCCVRYCTRRRMYPVFHPRWQRIWLEVFCKNPCSLLISSLSTL